MGFDDDTLAMSESIGIALLVGLTVTVTAIVGMNVLMVTESDGDAAPSANFTYDYAADAGLLIVTHSRGDDLQAGNIEFRGPGENVTWAQLANRNETAMIGEGDVVQLGSENAWDSQVSGGDTVRIYYNESGNRTQLSQWSGNR